MCTHEPPAEARTYVGDLTADQLRSIPIERLAFEYGAITGTLINHVQTLRTDLETERRLRRDAEAELDRLRGQVSR